MFLKLAEKDPFLICAECGNFYSRIEEYEIQGRKTNLKCIDCGGDLIKHIKKTVLL